MNAPVLLAQLQGTTTQSNSPPRHIKLEKPPSGATVTVNLQGLNQLDFSDIASEKLTFVRVGDKLIVLFDNQSTITIDPVFSSDGHPLNNITFEMAPDHMLTGDQFAADFPISTDQSILPAAGAGSGPTAGAHFSDPTVDPLSIGNPLPLLGAENNGTTFGAFIETAANTPPTSTPITAVILNEDGLPGGNPGGPGDVGGLATTFTGSLNINFGTVTGHSLAFSATQSTFDNITSGGEQVHFTVTTVGGEPTLIAYVGTDPTIVANEVLTISLDASTPNGQFTVTLMRPLDDPIHGTEDTLDLSINIIATNAVGQTVTQVIPVDVNDDSPIINAANETHSTITDPVQFTHSTATGSLGISFGADNFNTDPNGGDTGQNGDRAVFFTNSTVTTTGDNHGVVTSFTGLTSDNQIVHYVLLDNATVLVGYTGNTAPTSAPVTGGEGESEVPSNIVFVVSLSDVSNTGSYTITQYQPLDHISGGTKFDSIDLTFNFTATDSDGDPISGQVTMTVDDTVPTLTGATTTQTVGEDGLPDGNHIKSEVQTLTVTTSLDVNWGADSETVQPGSSFGRTLSFLAGDDTTAIAGSTNPVTSLAMTIFGEQGTSLSSEGTALVYVISSNGNGGETLTATAGAGGPTIFTLSLDPTATNGAYTFTLDGPLDHAVGSDTISLVFTVQATDADGDSINQTFGVNVQDDIPVLTGTIADQTVGEEGLSFGNHNVPGEVQNASTGVISLDIGWGADNNNSGTTNNRSVAFASNTISTLQGMHLTSDGQALSYSIVTDSNGQQELIATVGSGNHATQVFTVQLSDANNGSYDFTLLSNLDHPTGHGENNIEFTFNVVATDDDGDSVNQTFNVNVQDDVPIAGTGTAETVKEANLFDGSSPDIHDLSVTGSLNVSWGADNNDSGNIANRSVSFQHATASADVQVTDGNGNAITGLTSNGATVQYLIFNGELIAYTNNDPFHHQVFTVSLNDDGSGSYTFTLLNNLDHPAGNGNNTLNLTFDFTATDSDGDPSSNTFTVTVVDDVPTAHVGDSTLINEANLPDGNAPLFFGLPVFPQVTGDLNITWGADNGPARSVSFENGNAALDVSVTDSHGNAITGLTSDGNTVNYAFLNGVLVGYTGNNPHFNQVFTVSLNDNGDGSYTFTLLGNLDHPTGQGTNLLNFTFDFTATDSDGDSSSNVFTVSVKDSVPLAFNVGLQTVGEEGLADANHHVFGEVQNASTNNVSLNIAWGADDGPARTVEFSSNIVSSLLGLHLTSDGQALSYTVSPDGTLLTASAGGHSVFTVQLSNSGDGTYDFTLLGNLDHQNGNGENFTNITFNVVATDSDGDPVNQSFTVGIQDDVPILVGNVTNGTVSEDGLPSGNNINGANHTITLTNEALNISWGADNGTQPGDANGRTLSFNTTGHNTITPVDSQGHALSLTSDGTALQYVLTNLANGGQELDAYRGSTHNSSTLIFSVTLDPTATHGAYSFTLSGNLDDFSSHGTPTTDINLNFGVTATDSDGDTVQTNFTVDVLDDVPTVGAAVAAEMVFESGLSSGTTPNNVNDPTSVTQALNVNWGADNGTQPSDANGRSLSFLAGNGTTVLNGGHSTISSLDVSITGEHGTALSSGGVALVYTVTALNNGGETLTAYAGNTNGPEIFTLTLDPTQTHGSYTFTLMGPLDDASNSNSIGLTFTVQASDSDGDTVNTSFTVNVTDDAPVVSGNVTNGTVSEADLPLGTTPNTNGTTTGTEGLNINWGADNATHATDANGRTLSFLNSTGTAVIAGGTSLVSVDMGITGEHGTALSSGGVALVYTVTANTNGGETLTAYAGSTFGPQIFTLTLDPTQTHGGYVFNLTGPLDDASNSSAIVLNFTVQAADADGDTVNTSFTVTVNDDAPIVSGNVHNGTVSEADLPLGTTPNMNGTTTGIEALNINWGADNATHPVDASGRTLSFLNASGTAAIAGGTSLVTTDMSITGEHGTALTSGGVALVYTVTANTNGNGGETLTAYAGSTSGPQIFTLMLDPQQTHGGYTFNLTGPLDDASGSSPIVLTFTVQAADADGDTVNTSFNVTVNDDAPVLSGNVTNGTVSEADLPLGTTPNTNGTTTGIESLNINWGADNATHPTDINGRTLSFLSTGNAVISGSTSLVSNLAMSISGEQGTALTSHGVALVYTVTATSNGGETLTAYAGSTTGPQIFTLTLDPTQAHGGYTFNLTGPLDDAASPNSNSIGLTFSVQAADADGDTVNTSFSVTVNDDVPVDATPATTTVLEHTLVTQTTASISESLGINFGADGPAPVVTGGTVTETFNFNTGGAVLSPDLEVQQGLVNFATQPGIVTGGLNDPIIIVANTGKPFTLDSVNLGLFGTTAGTPFVTLEGFNAAGVMVAQLNVNVTQVGAITAGTPTLFNAAGTVFDGLEITKLEIFTGAGFAGNVMADNLTVTQATSSGTTVVSGPVEFTNLASAIANVSAHDNLGNTVNLANLTSGGQAVHFELIDAVTLVAYTGNTPPTSTTGTNVVFSVVLSEDANHPNGTYTFTLDKPLDDFNPGTTPTSTVNFTFNFTATDFDGDSTNNHFTVNVTDDTPTVGTAVAAETVSEGGLTGGNSPGATISLTEALNINWGADNATQPGDAHGRTLSFLAGDNTTVIGGGTGAVSSLALSITGEQGTALTSGGVALVYTVAANSNGGETLTAHLGTATGAAVFTLTLDPTQPNGGYVFNLLGTLDDASNSNSIGLTFTVQAADADGDTVNTSFVVNVTDDQPTVTGTVAAQTVGEEGLSFGNHNLPGESQTATTNAVSLNISWGADSNNSGTTDNRSVTFATNTVSTLDVMNLTSHGQALSYLITTDSNGEQLLTASAGGHTVFTVQLSDLNNGSYNFTLMAELDHPTGQGENFINLSFGVVATDADGDSVTQSFAVNVQDDIPVDVTPAATTVLEHALVSQPGVADAVTSSLGISFGADGPAPAGNSVGTGTTHTFTFNELSAGHNTAVHEDTFTFATDQGVVNTSGNGEIFGSQITITNGGAPFVLSSIDLGIFVPGDGSQSENIKLIGTDINGHKITDVVQIHNSTNVGDTLTFTYLAGTKFDGVQLTSLQIASPSNNFNGDVIIDNFTVVTGGAPATPGPVAFADLQTAINNISAVDNAGHTVDLTHLTSGGQAVHYALLDSATLVAYIGNTAPTSISASDVVFSVSLSQDLVNNPHGAYTFTLDKPLDDLNPTPTSAVNFTFDFTATDFDGDTAAGNFTVNVQDDVPTVGTVAASEVLEATLVTSPSTPDSVHGSLEIGFGADGPAAPGIPANPGTPETFNFDGLANGALSTAQGTFGNFVFTANQGVANGTLEGTLITLKDSATPFTLTSVDLGLAGQSSGSSFDNVTLIGLDSHGNQIASVTVNIGSLLANPGDPLTYTFDAAGTAFAGLQISTLEVMPAEHTSNLNASAFIDNVVVATGAAPAVPGPVAFTDLATAINNISIVDDQGNSVSAATLTSHGQTVHYELLDTATLVAYTGSAPTSINASNVVFSVVLSQDPVNNPDGGYTFTLDKPLDDLPASVTDLKFTFGFTATDFDGDTAAGKFTVDVHDDVPTLVAQTPVSIVDGNFLGGAGDFPTPGSWSQPLGAIDNKGFIEGWTYTASPVGGATQVELERVDSGYSGSISPDGSPMVDLEASPGNIQVSQTIAGLTNGEHLLVSFAIGEANFGNAELNVLWDGQSVGIYNPQNGLMQVETIAVTGNGSGTDTLTFQEIGVAGDNTGTFLTDVSAQQVAGTVFEAGLNDFVTSTVPVPGQTFTQTITTHIVGTEAGAANAPTTASGTLAPLVHFGADGPAMNGAANDGFQLTLQNNQAATTFVTGLGLTSLGSSVDAATINGNTLTASAADGHNVFSLTVNGDGSWTFNLIAPLNDPHLGADSITLDFSSLVKAVDFDGDTVNLAAGTFNVAVVDDVPVDTGTPVTGTVSETGLPGVQFAAESLDIAFGADGESGHLAFASNSISQLNGLNLTSNGVALTYEIQTTSGGEQQIVAFRPDQGDSNPVFEVTLNSPVNPEYIFTLFQPLDHNGTLPLNFSVVATDGDGDTVNQSFTVNIQDSVPAIGISVVGDVSEDGPKTLTDAPLNISFGTDNGTFPGSHLGLAFTDGAVAATDPNGNAVALTSYGQAISIGFINGELIGYTGTTEPTSTSDGHIVFTATLNAATDSYDFTLNQPLDHPAPVGTNDSMNLTFDITATDADGSTATGHFTVNVDAAGTIGSIDYNNETTGVFVNLSDNSATDPSDGQTVAGHTSTDLASGGGHVIGIDQLGSIADASGGSANDIFVPGSSNATIHGGGGVDTAMYTATALTTGSFSYDSTTQSWVVTTTNEGTDHLQGVEVVTDNSGHRFLLVGGGSEYTTIQSAINAAQAGDTILIAPGTYTETATALGTTGGLYINTAGLTLQGYSSLDGSLITTAAQAAANGPTVISGAENDFGANFLIGTGGTGTTIEGLHLEAGADTTNKLIEITADGVTIKNSFVDTNFNGHDTGAAAVYIDNQGTPINSYLIDHNILNEGIYVASGVGTPGTISLTQIISNNEFAGAFDPTTGLGRYDMVAVQGQIPGIAWQPDSAQIPTIISNTLDNNETPFIFRMAEANPALFPTASEVATIVADNTNANTSYAYVLSHNGVPHLVGDNLGGGTFYEFFVANSIDTLDAGIETTPNAIFNASLDTMNSGDTIMVQSVGHTVSDIVVDNLLIDATATSTDLNLTLDPAFSVQKITLLDYAPGQGANVNVTGNDLGDTIIGNSGDNTLKGGAGNDIIVGGFGADTISGLGGNDQIDGGQNLVVNGGFNAPEDIVGSASPLATIAGWTISGGTVDVVATNGSLHAVFPGGINMIDTKGVTDGTISQTINTVVGDTYTVTFLLGTNPDILTNTAYNSAGVTVSATGNASQDFIHAIESGTTWANIEPTLADETYTFTATSTSTTISFAADPQAGNLAYGALIGQVYVEDATAALDGNNVITDGDGNDVIQGGGGNDTITVGNGNDLIIGGSGNDTITVGNGTDFIVGGSGTTTINGGAGTDYFVYTAGDGHQTVIGGAGTGTQIVNGIATSETFVIGAIDPTHLGISIGTTEANAQLAISDTGVQELVINLGTAGDNVVVNGSLDGTGLATHTITINGGAGNDTVDLSQFTSNQDVVYDGAGNGASGDTVIYGFAFHAAGTSYSPILDSNGNLIGANITYQSPNGDGPVTDTITNVENFDFAGTTLTLHQLFPPVIVSAETATLTEAGDLPGVDQAGLGGAFHLAPALAGQVAGNTAVTSELAGLATNPSDVANTLATIEGQLHVNEATAIAIVWDNLNTTYVTAGANQPNINEAFVYLGIEYAAYLKAGGTPLTDIVAKFTADMNNDGIADRDQSLHDNLLGNITTYALDQHFSSDPSLITTLSGLISAIDPGLLDRPYASGNEGDPANAQAHAFDVADGFANEAHGTLVANDPIPNAALTWSISGPSTYGTMTIDAHTGAWTYVLDDSLQATQALAQGDNVNQTFTATVTDAFGNTDTTSVTITIDGSNDAPVISASSVTSAVVAESSELPGFDQAGPNGAFHVAPGLAAEMAQHPQVAVDLANFAGNPSLGLVDQTVSAIEIHLNVNEATAIAVVWDSLNTAYVAAGANQAAINEAFVYLGIEYAAYLKNGGTPLVDVTAKFAADANNDGIPDRDQSLHDNLLGNITTYALNQHFSSDPSLISTLTADISAVNADLLNRPYASGNEGDPGNAAAQQFDSTEGFAAAPATNTLVATGQLFATDPDHGATQTWSIVNDSSTVYGTMTINAATGQWTYTLDNSLASTQALAQGETATQTFTATVTDDHGATDTINVTVTIDGVNDAPVISASSVVAATVTEAGELPGVDQASLDSAFHLAPSLVSLMASHPQVATDLANFAGNPSMSVADSTLSAIETHLSVNEATAIAIVWDNLNTAYVAQGANQTLINEAFVYLGVEYAAYLKAGGEPLVDVAAKFAEEANGTIDRDQSLHDNLLGNITEAALQQHFAGDTATLTALTTAIDNVDPNLLNRPYASGNAGDPGNDQAHAFDVANGYVTTATGTLVATDPDHGATQTWSIVNDSSTVYGTMAINAATGAWTYTLDNSLASTQELAAGQTATQTFTATVTDDHGATATTTVTITIDGTNDAATFAGVDLGSVTAAGATSAGTPTVGGTLVVSDVDSSNAVMAENNIVTAYGHFSIDTNGVWSYTLDNTNSTVEALTPTSTPLVDVMTVTTQDGTTHDIDVSIHGGVHAPVISNIDGIASIVPILDTAGVDNGLLKASGNLLSGVSDADGATVTLTSIGGVTVDPTNGATVITNDGILHVNALGDYSFTASAGLDGETPATSPAILLNFTVTSSEGATASSTLELNIIGAADTPTVNPVFATAADTPAQDAGTVIAHGNLITDAGDSDRDTGVTLTVTSFAGIAMTPGGIDDGPWHVNPDGSYTYTANAAVDGLLAGQSETLSPSFTVTSSDGASASSQINLTITGAADTPVLTNTVFTGSEAEHTATSNVVYQVTATDRDASPNLVYSLGTGGDNADFSISSTGAVTFNNSPDYLTQHTFNITVNVSENGAVASENVTINVTPVDTGKAPLSITDITAGHPAPVVGDVLQVNLGSDPDGGPIGLVGLQWVENGAVVGTGPTYTVAAGDVGNTITLEASYTDGKGFFDTVTSGPTGTVVSGTDLPPVNSVPLSQVVAKNGTLVFDSAHQNLISVSDPDTAVLTEQLTVSAGTLTLHGTSGLTFTAGDGTADATMTFSGTQAAINAALAGMTYTPSTGTFLDTLIVSSFDGTFAVGNSVSIGVGGNMLTTSPTDLVVASATNSTIAALLSDSNATLQETDRVFGGSEFDTLSLKVTGSSGGSFNFGTMTAFTGMDEVQLASNPSQAVSLTFGNSNVANGQTFIVDGSADNNKAFAVDASGVTDGGNFTIIAAANTSNTLKGGTGNDIFEFQSGNIASTDTVSGGGGNDTLQFVNAANIANDSVFAGFTGIENILLANTATNVLTLGADAAAMAGGVGHTLTVDAHLISSTADTFTLNAGSFSGNLTVITGAENDTITAGSGNDTFVFLNANFASGDHIAGGTGFDTIKITDQANVVDNSFTNVTGVEDLVFTSNLANTVTLDFRANNAILTATNSTLTIDDSASSGNLTVITTADFTHFTNSAHLNIIGGSGNDLIELSAEHFTGLDTINGGAGINTIQILDGASAQTGSAITDAAFAHISNIEDVTFSAANTINSVTLGSNAAADAGSGTLTLDGHATLQLNVNASASSANLDILGGTGSDTITAGSGNETIDGGTGNDTITAGVGADIFAYGEQGSTNFDHILNFNSANDKIDISALLGSNANSINSGNLGSYVDFKISGSDVVMSVDTSGHGSFGAANEVAVLTGAASNAHIVDVVFSSLDHQVQVHA